MNGVRTHVLCMAALLAAVGSEDTCAQAKAQLIDYGTSWINPLTKLAAKFD